MTPPDRTCPSVLVVMGVSGSGKTTIASLLARRLGWAFEDGDWFHPKANVDKMTAGIALTDQDREPWLASIAEWIEETRASERHGVIACSALKRAYRTVLVGRHPDAVRIVYLDGSRELIAARMALRHGHFMPTALLDTQFATLEVLGSDERPITASIEPSVREVVAAIVSALEREVGGAIPADP